MAAAPEIIRIDSPDDPRIADYRLLKERELAADGGKFIAEGELVARRLLASTYPVESVLLAEHRAPAVAPLAGPHTPVYVAPAGVIEHIIGFRFHSGVLACGRRKAPEPLASLADRWPGRATMVVLPEVTKLDNLGAILRVCGAFGAACVLLGPRCCDPFYRKALRVAMGTTFSLSLHRSADLEADLAELRRRDVELVATVLDQSAEPLNLARRGGGRVALLLGNEGFGLTGEQAAMCGRQVRIPMQLGIDSLNVATAAAVFLYHYTLVE